MKGIIGAGLFGFALLVLAGTGTLARDNDKKDTEKKGTVKLAGTYTIVSGQEDGKPIPAERIKGSTVTFTGNKIFGTDKERKEFFSATYTLDTSKTPWVINMTSKEPKEAKTSGLIKKEGETVTIIYALPGGEAPKDFKTGPKQQLFVLKPASKVGKEPVKP